MARRRLFDSDGSYRLALPVLLFLYLVVQIPRAKDLILLGGSIPRGGTMDAWPSASTAMTCAFL
mgnify:CR=1 FL=1